jgi:serine/threonine protein kinase
MGHSMPLAAGTRLGPYEIVCPLGAGGMGEVYRARDERLHRTVAIKVLAPHLSANPNVRVRFEREAKTISSLQHAHICVLHDIGKQADVDFLVMEYLEGETLRHQLRRGAMPVRKAVECAQQIAQGLAAAHDKGIIHRDLKPENIFITREGCVKILDFWPLSYDELAPYYDRIERMIGVCGNDDGLEVLPAGPWYLPPLALRCSEQILKRAVAPLGIPVIAVRKALLTRDYDNRPACHYCGHCMDGCDVSAIFSTPSSMLPKARKTGNLTLRQNAVAREILVDNNGLARAVSIVDRSTRKEEEIRARIVVVCCATVETARLLLNSRSSRYPTGLANSSDAVGRYLHGHLGDTVHIYLKELEGRPPENSRSRILYMLYAVGCD